MYKYLIAIVISCCVLVPAYATESPEALAKRVAELEKANFVLHEALARNRIALDQVIDVIQQTVTSLDTKTNEQNAQLQELIANTITDLQANIHALQQQLGEEVAMRDALAKSIAEADLNSQQEEIARQKELLAKVDDSISNTKKSLQSNADALLQLLSQEIAMRVAQTNENTAKTAAMRDNLTAMLELLSQEMATRVAQSDDVAATREEFSGNIDAIKQLLAKEMAARDALAKEAENRNGELEAKIAALQKGVSSLALEAYYTSGAAGNDRKILNPETLEPIEIARVRIINENGGEISASHDFGASWNVIGHVVTAADATTDEEYSRKWAPSGAIAGTAIHNISVRTGYDTSAEVGKVFSILPQSAADGKRRATAKAAILTDIPAGAAIFGGDWTPMQGNPVFLETPLGLRRIPEKFTPKQGDVFVINVLQPSKTPQSYVFENTAGGIVKEMGWDGSEKIIGTVLVPVKGIGRFAETAATDVSRLSASLNGMLEFSTAPLGEVGGFRILLSEEEMNADLMRASALPHYMVVAENGTASPSWDGLAPLFLGMLRPRWSDTDWESDDWLRLVTSRVLLEVRINNGPWQTVPALTLDGKANAPLPDWANTALGEVTHIRIHPPAPVALP